MYESEALNEMRGLEGVGGRVVWLYGSEGLHEMRGHEGVGGRGLPGRMGQRDYMRGGIHSIKGCWVKN